MIGKLLYSLLCSYALVSELPYLPLFVLCCSPAPGLPSTTMKISKFPACDQVQFIKSVTFLKLTSNRLLYHYILLHFEVLPYRREFLREKTYSSASFNKIFSLKKKNNDNNSSMKLSINVLVSLLRSCYVVTQRSFPSLISCPDRLLTKSASSTSDLGTRLLLFLSCRKER